MKYAPSGTECSPSRPPKAFPSGNNDFLDAEGLQAGIDGGLTVARAAVTAGGRSKRAAIAGDGRHQHRGHPGGFPCTTWWSRTMPSAYVEVGGSNPLTYLSTLEIR